MHGDPGPVPAARGIQGHEPTDNSDHETAKIRRRSVLGAPINKYQQAA